MAFFLSLPKLLICFSLIYFLIISFSSVIQAQIDESNLGLITDALEWPTSISNLYEEEEFGGDEVDIYSKTDRRSLFWRRVRYYISYGALSANRIPCPPRSGRSYYTHNCNRARGPVHPYSRGCSKITRCRR